MMNECLLPKKSTPDDDDGLLFFSFLLDTVMRRATEDGFFFKNLMIQKSSTLTCAARADGMTYVIVKILIMIHKNRASSQDKTSWALLSLFLFEPKTEKNAAREKNDDMVWVMTKVTSTKEELPVGIMYPPVFEE
jgi:hypothetical protein